MTDTALADLVARERLSERPVVIPFQFGLHPSLKIAGGLCSTIVRQAREDSTGRDVTFFTCDSGDFTLGAYQIRAADPLTSDISPTDLRRARLGGPNKWGPLNSPGFCTSGQPEEVAALMYAHLPGPEGCELGSYEHLLQVHNRVYPTTVAGRPYDAHHAEQFRRLFGDVRPGTVVRWQDFIYTDAIHMFADELRASGCIQTYHHHSPLYEGIGAFKWGREFLEAMAKMDVVYVHTELFGDRLAAEMKAAGLEVPIITRYDLGIDESLIHDSIKTVTPSSFAAAIPEFTDLPQHQQAFIAEMMGTRDRIPHRFFMFDRGDPLKGWVTGVQAVRQFLEEELQGSSRAALARDFRFYFIWRTCEHGDGFDPLDMAKPYCDLAERQLMALQRDFPEVVFVGESIKGNQRLAMGAMQVGCNSLSTTLSDGLHLGAMEFAVANEGRAVGHVIGKNAGLVTSLQEHGLGDLLLTPRSGSVSETVDAIRSVVREQATNRGESLRGRNDAFVNHVRSRQHSLVNAEETVSR